MKIEVNGTEQDIGTGLHVTELLKELKVEMPDMVSVEINGEILKRNDFDTTLIEEGDRVEFLYFMGGGKSGRKA